MSRDDTLPFLTSAQAQALKQAAANTSGKAAEDLTIEQATTSERPGWAGAEKHQLIASIFSTADGAELALYGGYPLVCLSDREKSLRTAFELARLYIPKAVDGLKTRYFSV